MRHTVAAFSVILILAFTGCSGFSPVPDTTPSERNTTFSGSIPCADCRSQTMTVTLFRNHTFRLKRVYSGLRTGGSKTVYDLGRWSRKGSRLVLDNGERWPLQFRFVSGSEIRLLDQRGNEIVSKLDYSLRKTPFVDMLSGPMPLRGGFRYMADAYTFSECKTGKTYPLVFERPNGTVESKYLALRPAPGKSLMATLKGRFVMRRPEKGAPAREHVVVRSFGRFWPGATCKSSLKPVSFLAGTYWRAISVAGFSGSLNKGKNAPYIVLSASGGTLKGFTGCNSLMGTYTDGKATISFSKLTTTRMACPGKSGDVERVFLEALGKTASWKITGKTLELLDRRHRLLMRLKAK